MRSAGRDTRFVAAARPGRARRGCVGDSHRPRCGPWRCCTNRHGPARCQPTGSSPADAIRHWSAEGGPGWAPDAKILSDDGLVAQERVLHPALTGEHPTWGYTRIRGAPSNLGHNIARNTVKRIDASSSTSTSRIVTIVRETTGDLTTSSCNDRHLRYARTPTFSGVSASAGCAVSTIERPHEWSAH